MAICREISTELETSGERSFPVSIIISDWGVDRLMTAPALEELGPGVSCIGDPGSSRERDRRGVRALAGGRIRPCSISRSSSSSMPLLENWLDIGSTRTSFFFFLDAFIPSIVADLRSLVLVVALDDAEVDFVRRVDVEIRPDSISLSVLPKRAHFTT